LDEELKTIIAPLLRALMSSRGALEKKLIWVEPSFALKI